jgi:rubrerythrin
VGSESRERGVETKFNVFEILQIAEQVEHKGAKFYLKTAELFDDASLRDIYYRLATWKAKHEKIWARILEDHVKLGLGTNRSQPAWAAFRSNG